MNLRKLSSHILRIGLGITFVWIGIMIFQNPEAWGGYIQPWAAKLLPIPLRQAMLSTAFLDIGIGVLLIVNLLTWLAGLLGSLHLLVVLITAGINAITVRDIGLLSAAFAITLSKWPRR